MNWSIVSLGISFIWVVGGIVYFAWGRYFVKYAKKNLALSQEKHRLTKEIEEYNKKIKKNTDQYYKQALHYWRQAKEMGIASKKVRREARELLNHKTSTELTIKRMEARELER